ncbi:MAG: M20/M25/M40 family metallo-hydrolase [Intrasporangium sp.]|uniref:M20/M25/M40 family metallo-hydrolase n=1 Tax=Intrasporangium sp. TaxID=1925024 RepID=UPI002649D45E|nr:M20/M25/M40 family metallo-hydrolase [Intrasporangium sp.]MDN5796511.1 M20/M25/M40 family metallo-hydrolase [Intrasporangium sp.]
MTSSASLTPAQRRVLDSLDEPAMVDRLRRLVRVPSVTGTDAESELQNTMAGDLAGLGFEVDLWRLDLEALEADPDHPGTEVDRSEGYGLVGLAPGEGEPGFVLQGHVDVVPVGDPAAWAGGDPFGGAVTGDVVHGRGACDMKAGVAVNFAVAQALATSGVRFEKRFALHQVVSEEDGGLGAFATMKRGHRGEAAVITEPTSGRIVVANAGALTFEIRVPGRAAHGSTRLEGVSAFEAFWPVHAALRALEQRINAAPGPLFDGNPLPYGISVGTIRAGDWASSVPDLLVAQGRLGVPLDGDPVVARAQLEEAVAQACAPAPWVRAHPATVARPGGPLAPGHREAGHPLVGQTADAVELTQGRRPRLGAAPYGSDLRLYVGVGGIPTLHYGPGDVRLAHAPREQVSVSEMFVVARALAVLAVDRLGGHL